MTQRWQQVAEGVCALEITGVGCLIRAADSQTRSHSVCFVPGVRVENMALVAGTHFIAQVTSSGSGGTVALKPNLAQEALELCWQIEKCGASEALTKASVMASALQAKLSKF